jgi:transcriptional regulator with XRE-family HTH domain
VSQERLAELAGIHRTYVSEVERGKVSPGLDVAKKLADALGIPLSVLVSQAEEAGRE